MVAEAVQELAQTSTASTSATEDRSDIAPVTAAETPGSGDGGEAPEPVTPPRTPDSYDRAELDSLYRDGKLTDPALVTRRDTLHQQDSDRQRQNERAVAEMEAQREARSQAILQSGAQAFQAIEQAVASEIAAAANVGRDPDLALIRERVGTQLGNLLQRTEQMHLEPHMRGLERALLQLNGDTPQNRRAIDAMDMPQRMAALYEAAYTAGQRSGPGDGYVVKKESEHKAEIEAAEKKGRDAVLAANPGFKTPDLSGTPRQPAGDTGALTKEKAETLSISELIAIRQRQQAS